MLATKNDATEASPMQVPTSDLAGPAAARADAVKNHAEPGQ